MLARTPIVFLWLHKASVSLVKHVSVEQEKEGVKEQTGKYRKGRLILMGQLRLLGPGHCQPFGMLCTVAGRGDLKV